MIGAAAAGAIMWLAVGFYTNNYDPRTGLEGPLTIICIAVAAIVLERKPQSA